ncbi:hypothetical protein HBI56_230240 [Parastagonospora nodorum]|uniref:Pectate lyase superfamily protein domain-containing protein n=1 Tax=Phaeosphaeria nodorum (strain SN15 / ATCC MYA-4574 / FGSC 10173) TaxID=321614 RepID=A0A7U2FJB5_PHANO|nr:hypothetical protein HBH56_223170 [Parastagonospora nodorum]QRD04390.1 hypothetical protein JI435_160900 [Parastagonospora nodorum SN15]KAH3921950.1 hypothetical protein HBH54_231320 [Parastagonospora nodorum]KAH3991749.1 hypothetical protein HBI10_227590 [Parastagonospora nodorum]KAH4008839.1 hypothetical protein HBI13_230310 [Parastagonospora nodorum]
MILSRTATLLVALPLLVHAANIDYKKAWTAAGDRLPDFSYAGYHQSEIALPALSRPATKTLTPSSGDQSSVIQTALDSVAKSGGGVVELKAGTYTVSHGLLIDNQTTLRGVGPGKTILELKDLIEDAIIMGNSSGKPKMGKPIPITDDYVPAGTQTVHVADAGGLTVGMHVMVSRAVTQAWIDAQGMAPYPKWLQPGKLVQQPRRIMSVSNKEVSLDIPLTDSLNAAKDLMTSIALIPFTPPAQPCEMGVENLSIRLSPSCSGTRLGAGKCDRYGVVISSWTTDSWLRNLDLTGFNGFINTQKSSSRLTITNVVMNRDGLTDNGAGYALDISIEGTQVLVHNCKTAGGEGTKSYGIATKTLTAGPNACIGYEAQQPVVSMEPHQRWAHGFLLEGSTNAAVVLRDRAGAGTGQGLSINNGVAWNTNASSYTVQNPPLGQNYCFGCVGPKNPKLVNNGTYESYGTFVDPSSLFKAQLRDRGFSFQL